MNFSLTSSQLFSERFIEFENSITILFVFFFLQSYWKLLLKKKHGFHFSPTPQDNYNIQIRITKTKIVPKLPVFCLKLLSQMDVKKTDFVIFEFYAFLKFF